MGCDVSKAQIGQFNELYLPSDSLRLYRGRYYRFDPYVNRFVTRGELPGFLKDPRDWTKRDYDNLGEVLSECLARELGRKMGGTWGAMGAMPFAAIANDEWRRRGPQWYGAPHDTRDDAIRELQVRVKEMEEFLDSFKTFTYGTKEAQQNEAWQRALENRFRQWMEGANGAGGGHAIANPMAGMRGMFGMPGTNTGQMPNMAGFNGMGQWPGMGGLNQMPGMGMRPDMFGGTHNDFGGFGRPSGFGNRRRGSRFHEEDDDDDDDDHEYGGRRRPGRRPFGRRGRYDGLSGFDDSEFRGPAPIPNRPRPDSGPSSGGAAFELGHESNTPPRSSAAAPGYTRLYTPPTQHMPSAGPTTVDPTANISPPPMVPGMHSRPSTAVPATTAAGNPFSSPGTIPMNPSMAPGSSASATTYRHPHTPGTVPPYSPRGTVSDAAAQSREVRFENQPELSASREQEDLRGEPPAGARHGPRDFP